MSDALFWFGFSMLVSAAITFTLGVLLASKPYCPDCSKQFFGWPFRDPVKEYRQHCRDECPRWEEVRRWRAAVPRRLPDRDGLV